MSTKSGVCRSQIRRVALASNGYARAFNKPASVPLVPGILLLVPGSVGFKSVLSMLERAVVPAMERYRSLHPPALEIAHARFSIKQKMEDMVSLVRTGAGKAALSDVFRSLSGRAEAIAIFLAVLELLRLGWVRALQSEEFGEIYLESTGADMSLENYEEAYR